MAYKVTPENFTRVNNDTNGNPRFVLHYLAFDEQGSNVHTAYENAIAKAKKIGGRKFHNKQYGGGIVFGSVYNISDLCKRVNKHLESIGLV